MNLFNAPRLLYILLPIFPTLMSTYPCRDLMQHCQYEQNSSSCTLTTTLQFGCSMYGADSAQMGDMQSSLSASQVGMHCQWSVAGDLIIASNVLISIVSTQAQQCFLYISVGKRLLLENNATLSGSSFSIDASFVRLGKDAKILTTYESQDVEEDRYCGAYNAGMGGCSPRAGNEPIVPRAVQAMQIAMSSKQEIAWNISHHWKILLASEGFTSDQAESQRAASKLLFGRGSIGLHSNNSDLFTRGGGRIRIVASRDLVMLHGAAILANGEAAGLGVAGGSGGSVYLSANAISITNGSVQARGGNAFCSLEKDDIDIADCYGAGGGGRIMVAYQSSELNDTNVIDTSGGTYSHDQLSDIFCAKIIGAAGTLYEVKHDINGHISEANLITSNKQQHILMTSLHSDLIKSVVALTPLVLSNTSFNEESTVSQVIICDGAVVVTNELRIWSDAESISGNLILSNGSILIADIGKHELQGSVPSENDAIVHISAFHISMQSKSRFLALQSPIKLNAKFTDEILMYSNSFAAENSVCIEFGDALHIHTTLTLNLDANVPTLGGSKVDAIDLNLNTAKQKRLILQSDSNVLLGGHLEIGSLYVFAQDFIIMTHGSIVAGQRTAPEATFSSCQNMSNKSIHTRVEQALASNYTLVFHAENSISIGYDRNISSLATYEAGSYTLAQSMILASTILLCAEKELHISSKSTISSSGLGALANQGAGRGSCIGSIGGGAGYGGHGADSSHMNAGGDYASGGLVYGTKSGDGMVGSGGGCVDGGAGGGFVVLGASSLVLNGSVRCDGASGVRGTGGGSGGFLGFTVFKRLAGSGRITAMGGNATCVLKAQHKTEDIAISPVISFLQSPPVQLLSDANAPNVDTIDKVCGGGGGGGRLQLHGCKGSGYDQCTRYFLGTYKVLGGISLDFDKKVPIFPINEPISPGNIIPVEANSSVRISPLTKQGSNGSFFGLPCSPGYGGLFCRICPIGTFKVVSNSDECKPCQNAPPNSHYTGPEGATNSNCPWACDPGYTGRSRCVSPLQQLLDTFGGNIGSIIVLISIVIFFILLGYMCRNRKEPSSMYLQHVNHEFYFTGAGSSEIQSKQAEAQRLLASEEHGGDTSATQRSDSYLFDSQSSLLSSIMRCISWPHIKYPKLMERDLPEHMARIYFSGTNDRNCPLQLRTSVPAALEPVIYAEEFRQFADQINDALAWPQFSTDDYHSGMQGTNKSVFTSSISNTSARRKVCCCWQSWGDFIYYLARIFCFPFAADVLQYRRHNRMNTLKQMIAKYNHAFMKGPRARGLLNAVKLGYSSDDYALVYLELLFKESLQSTCVPLTGRIGKPALPIVLVFAGRGLYESPLYLDPNDLLVRSIPQCQELTAFIDEQWIEIVGELNTLLRCVVCKEWGMFESLLPITKFLEAINLRTNQSQNNLLGGLCMHLGHFCVQDEDNMAVKDWKDFKLGLYLTTNSATSTANKLKPASSRKNKLVDRSTFAERKIVNGSGYDAFANGPLRNYGSSNGVTNTQRNSDDGLEQTNDMAWYTVSSPIESAIHSPDSKAQFPSTLPSMARSRIREEALRIKKSANVDDTSTLETKDWSMHVTDQKQRRYQPDSIKRQRRHPAFYKGWLGPIDMSLPIPGVLITTKELEDRVSSRSRFNKLIRTLHRSLLPYNVPLRVPRCLYRKSHLEFTALESSHDRFTSRSGTSSPIFPGTIRGGIAGNLHPSLISSVSWILHITLLCLLMVDLAITSVTIVNMKCVRNGQVEKNCTLSNLIPILLIPVPLAIIVAPVIGISSLALSSPQFSRRYSIWNMISLINVGFTIIAGVINESQLVTPWFAGSFPVLPWLLLAFKAGEACLIERYIAFQETYRRRRGWRGLLKRRISDASNSGVSPSMSPPDTP